MGGRLLARFPSVCGMTRPDRHRFVTLNPTWRKHRAAPSTCAERDGARRLLDDWIDNGRPLVVAASHGTDADCTVRLGLSTPKKQRYGLHIGLDAIDTILPAIRLADIAVSAPSAWQKTIVAVSDIAEQYQLDLSVFGSLAWTHVSGENHLNPASDLDLVMYAPPSADTLKAVRALLACDGVPRLDGELVLNDGAAVNLREFAAQPDQILIKQHGGPHLVPFATIMGRVGVGA